MVKELLNPHLVDACLNVGCADANDLLFAECIAEELLEKFWKMKDESEQISMAMIPIMAYIKKADRELDASRSKLG